MHRVYRHSSSPSSKQNRSSTMQFPSRAPLPRLHLHRLPIRHLHTIIIPPLDLLMYPKFYHPIPSVHSPSIASVANCRKHHSRNFPPSVCSPCTTFCLSIRATSSAWVSAVLASGESGGMLASLSKPLRASRREAWRRCVSPIAMLSTYIIGVGRGALTLESNSGRSKDMPIC